MMDERSPYRLYEISQVTHDVRQFKFVIPEDRNFAFLPGDFMKVYPDPGDAQEYRTYTPTTTPDIKDHFELVIKRYPNGIVSRFMHDRKIGDQVWMSGPHEGGHFKEGMASKVGMVAGGTGITPMIAIIRSIMQRDLRVQVSLIFANKTVDDIILKEEFDKYASERPNFKRYYVLDAAPPGWTMGQGRVSPQMMKDNLPEPSDQTVIFVCGPPMMQIGVQEELVALGYPRQKIIFP